MYIQWGPVEIQTPNTLEPDRPQHGPPRRLCYRPAVFFCHVLIISLSVPQGQIGGAFIRSFLVLELRNFKLPCRGGVSFESVPQCRLS